MIVQDVRTLGGRADFHLQARGVHSGRLQGWVCMMQAIKDLGRD